ncbi:MAG: ABC transporter substrate-binding protein [Actinobacteria bacterium]|nr:ABC transporter substrate-binding protein [Actinomycetota bacterium]MTH93896.1 ABC transporter substrate-binding protein [Actinomycetota bacterium]
MRLPVLEGRAVREVGEPHLRPTLLSPAIFGGRKMSKKSIRQFRGVTRRTFLAVGASALLFAACGNSDQSAADTVAEASSDTAVTEVFTNKIVSLSATATEMLYAIGAQDQLVAVDNYSNYPEAAASFENKIDASQPSAEAIAALDATVVLLAYDPGNLQTQLEALGITVWTGAAATSFDDSYKQITELGELTGKSTEAEALVASMKSDIETAVSSMELPDAPVSYFYELDNTYFSVTSNTFVGQIMSQFMLQNIADTAEAGNDYPQLSQEAIISANPQLVFLADTKCCQQDAQSVAARPGWNKIDAVAKGNVVELDDDVASRWGPRVVDLVKQVAAAVAKFVETSKK